MEAEAGEGQDKAAVRLPPLQLSVKVHEASLSDPPQLLHLREQWERVLSRVQHGELGREQGL